MARLRNWLSVVFVIASVVASILSDKPAVAQTAPGGKNTAAPYRIADTW
jgi:hypothetical protein